MLMMFCATCDSAFVGPPKFEPATLYDTGLKKAEIWVPATTIAMSHATIMSLRRFLRKELNASTLELASSFLAIGRPSNLEYIIS